MNPGPFPQNFEQWQHCITVECGIPLTAEYVEQRLRVWRDPNAEETERYRKLYGDAYFRFMLSCFEQAQSKLGAAG